MTDARCCDDMGEHYHGERYVAATPAADSRGLEQAARAVIEWADEVKASALEMDFWPDERFDALRAALTDRDPAP